MILTRHTIRQTNRVQSAASGKMTAIVLNAQSAAKLVNVTATAHQKGGEMPINSNRKGKAGEREAAAAISAVLGVAARRGQQFSGGEDSPDIVVDIPGVHFEVKRTNRLQIRKAVAQAAADAGSDNIPVVLHRWDRGPWLVVVPLEDLPELARMIRETDVDTSPRKADTD